MSAFQVTPLHIATLIEAATRLSSYRRLTSTEAVDLAAEFAMENAVSVNYRYSDTDPTVVVTISHFETARARAAAGLTPALTALKLLDGFVYQCSEHPGWKDSSTRTCCDSFQKTFIQALPGYDDAPREI